MEGKREAHLCGLHFGEQLWIPNNPRGILHLPTSLIQPRDNPYNRALQHVRQIRDPVERHSPCPFKYDFYKPKARLAGEVIGVVA